MHAFKYMTFFSHFFTDDQRLPAVHTSGRCETTGWSVAPQSYLVDVGFPPGGYRKETGTVQNSLPE